MERKDKSVRKKTDQAEAKPFNKSFYGKKVESTVGVNKNKTTKKWQPNDDLNEQTGTSLFETKKRNDFGKTSENSFQKDKKTYSSAGFNKKDKPFEEKTKADYRTKDKSPSEDFSAKTDHKFSNEGASSSKKRSYSEYKSARSSHKSDDDGQETNYAKRSQSGKTGGKGNDEYQETSPFKRKSIYDKTDDKTKTTFKKEYKPKLKSESKGPSKPRVVKDPNDDSIRLNKFISNAGICSRREADELIKAGAVTVNGKVITEMGFKIKRTDLVNYGGQGLKPERQVYILLNKPKDYITTSEDPQERRTVLELIKGACKERVYPVGRLDRNTTGLLLLTNDGELTDKITHPSFKQKKIYHVELDKPFKKEHLKAIEEGLELEDGLIKVDEIKYVDDADSKKEIGITLHSGRNRIVRRIFEHFEYKVKKLDRVYFAGLTKKDLARGRWRFLTPMEINMLKMVQ
jgi:23S rRNA pseudouridine2605 synthase